MNEAYQAVSFDNLDEPYTIEHPESESGFVPAVVHLPRPPTSFTLYFDYASPHLTAESQAMLATILEEITRHSAPDVRLHGHTDRAGVTADNERMSRRRVEAIRDQIIEAGVAAELVGVRWHGENLLAVETDDGVRESKNRRVEIRTR